MHQNYLASLEEQMLGMKVLLILELWLMRWVLQQELPRLTQLQERQ